MSERQPKYICPSCESPIYNRRYPKCERCGKPLPKELLYSADEKAAYDEEIKKLRTPPRKIIKAETFTEYIFDLDQYDLDDDPY